MCVRFGSQGYVSRTDQRRPMYIGLGTLIIIIILLIILL
jgi:hypothetical protein